MKRSNRSRILAFVMALVLVFSMVPVTAFAADSATYTAITSADGLTTGKYVLVASHGYAPTVLDGSWVLAEAVTPEDGVITNPAANLVWTITVDGSTVKLTDSNGTTIAPKGGNNNGIKSGDYSWTVTFENGAFQFAGQGEDTVMLASNMGSENKFRGYKTSTISGNPEGYPVDFTLYKLDGSGETTDPIESTPTEATEATEPEQTAAYTLTDTIAAGDVVVIYNEGSSSALSSVFSGYKLTAEALTPADGVISTSLETVAWTVGVTEDGYYTFSQGDLVLGMVQSGKYVNLSTSAADGHTSWTISEGTADATFYLQNVTMPAGNYGPYYLEYYSGFTAYASNSPSDAQFGFSFYKLDSGEEEQPPVSPAVEDGTYVIWEATNGKAATALSESYTYGYLKTVDVSLNNDVLTGYGETEHFTITSAGDGQYTIQDSYGRYLYMSGSYNNFNVSADLPASGHLWAIAANDNGTVTISNVEKGKTVSYDTGYGSYGAYATPGAAHLTALTLTPVVNEAPAPAVEDGTYVIWAPAYNMALSSVYTGYYNSGVAVTETDGTLSGYTAAELWTVTNNADGTISISYDGKNLGMADSYSSMTLGAAHDAWVLEDAGNGLFYVKNTVRSCYIEWYASKSNWSGFAYINAGSEGMFALKFTPAAEPEAPGASLPAEGDQVVLYNLDAQGVLAGENDTKSIENAPALIVDGQAHPGNGGVVFTVERNGDYFRFRNETYGYLCSNGTGNNAFYSLEASDDADWTIHEGKSGGWFLESRTAKYNGTYSQYLEYYADSYKTYSMYNVTNYDIYEFVFYPVSEVIHLTGGIVNIPTVDFGTLFDAYAGSDYTFTFTVDAVFGIEGELTVTVNGNALTANDDGSYTIPAALISGESLTITVSGVDTKGVEFSVTTSVTVKDEPSITDITPASNSETGENKRPVISAVIVNAGADAQVTMTVNGQTVDAVYDGASISYTPASDLAEGRTSVVVTVVRADGKTVTKAWSFIVGKAQFQLYFGQLHSHTTYSDGSGSLEDALAYIASLPDSANVDFVAFTDHSNYFDTSSAANPEGALYDMSLASAASQELWNTYKGTIAAFNQTHSDIIAIAGFEMTWSGGPGHINTFNTPGIVSRNNSILNNKTSDAGMKAYYSLLSRPEGVYSISQFNHPGSTFGTFSDFAYWDALIDTRIQLVEVGNGEGQIGAGGYYPSYEYYTMALDKGWHVAPTNNQDNHKGKWGNANDARDVILTDNFTEEGIYEAIRAMRMYATEDKNLEITYTVNGQMLGSTISEVPESLNIQVTVYDPDASDSISKVEVIVNSGKVAYTWDDPADLADGALECTIDPSYSYYYIRVTEGDGDLAVTAPVWVGETLKLGISAVETSTSTPVTGEELTVNTTLFNSESADAAVTALVYTIGDEVIGTDTTGYTIPASGTLTVNFDYTPVSAKLTTITVTAYVTLDGVDYQFTMDIKLDVQDASKLVYIGIDASHYNEYVNGNYKDSMGNFSQLAAGYSVRTVTLYTSEDLIAACSNDKFVALILTAPSRRSAEAQSADPLKIYTEEELAAIKAFNANGGTVILAGWSDHYENYPSVDSIANMQAYEHMAATQNAVLEALGSSLRIGDDATYDDDYNGGQAYRLYFNTYGDSFLTEGVEVDPEHPHDRMYTEVFSHYGGASVYTVDGTLPETVTPIVFGHSGTYSVDVDKDGLGGDSMPKYEVSEGDSRLMIMASEQLEGQGLIIVSGAAFMSNFEVQATIEDSGSEKNYSNYKICENLLAYINPVTVTDIADVRAETEVGVKFTIEGVVTSNASGYDKATAFFDCIYVQDATGGICCFPVAGNYKVGDLVRITGTTEFYQGEPELQVTSIEVIGEGTVTPTAVTASQINDRSAEGLLVTLTGTVESFELANGLVQTIMVKDAEGNVARVFIDGYITIDADVENLFVGCQITVTGLASYDDTFNAPDGPFPRIRVRSRADVVCTGTPNPFVDVEEGTFYYDAVLWGVESGITYGTSETTFSPYESCTRAQIVTFIWRSMGCPEPAGETSPFVDLNENAYYYTAVLWAYEQGIAHGTTAVTFEPDATCTRAQAVTFLHRAYSVEISAMKNPFSDVDENRYYYDAVLWAVDMGITAGMTETTFGPDLNCTRGHIMTFLYRLLAAE